MTAAGWTGAQFSLLRIAAGLTALYWSLTHWQWTPWALPIAAILLALGWFSQLAAIVVLALTDPLLAAAMPLFVLAPEGPYGAFRQQDHWSLSPWQLWIARLTTLALLVVAYPGPYWPRGILAFLTLLPPGWIPGRVSGSRERLYYDGHCGLCHRFIQFLLSEDPNGQMFRFAPLDSDSFRQNVPEAVRATLPDSVVLWTAHGRALTKSAAVLHVLHRLGGLWRVLAVLAGPVPESLLDALYDFIAGIRYRLFGRPEAVCPLMPKELRSRFDV